MEDIKVSIICNTYNQESYIGDALESFLMQKTNFPFEILVHDDASTDHTADVIREYEKKYPDIIKPIYQTENQYSQRKKITLTIQYARSVGKYIAMCEGDDYWTDENKLQKQFDFMEANPDCILCTHAADTVNAETKVVLGRKTLSANKTFFDMKDAINGFGRACATNSFFFRREIYEDVPHFFMIAPCGDYVLPIMGALKGTLAYLPDNMSAYRVCAKNSLTESWKKDTDRLLRYDQRYDGMLDEINKHTDYAYNDLIEAEKTRIWFNYFVRVKDKKSLRQERYRQYLKNLSFKKKISTVCQVYFPWVVKFYMKVKNIVFSAYKR